MKFDKAYDHVEHSVFKQLKISKSSEYFARSVITRNVDAYMNLKIAKGGKGKTRHISAPLIELSSIQKTILEELEKLVQQPPKGKRLIHPAAHAYRKHRSHTSAASIHLGMKWGVKVDLQKFYDHITEEHVYRALERAGLEDQAYFWTKLCTRVPHNWPEGLPAKYTRFQRALTQPTPGHVYDVRDRWFAELLPKGMLPKRLRKQSVITRSYSDSVFRMLPPKRLQRIFLHISTGRVRILNLKELEVQLLFERVKRIFGVTSDPKKNRELNKLIQESRKSWRSHILEMYQDRFTFGRSNGDDRQKHYPVRPEQYRMRRKVGYLPQGSPASGLISNMVMAQFDEVMFDFCKSNNLKYTRYSDDIVVSSKDDNFSRDRALKIVSFIQNLSEFNGFSLNKEKTRIMTPGSRKFVLGVLVDGESLRLGKHERERIERMIYQVAKFGDFWSDKAPDVHILNKSHVLPGKRLGSYDNPRFPSDPLSSLLGWLSYCKAADFKFLEKIHNQLQNGRWKFINSVQLDAITSHTSMLLKLVPKSSASIAPQNPDKSVGPNWNGLLSQETSFESDEEEPY